MRDHPPLSAMIEAWTREAVLTWGDDWTRISQYIERRLTTLDPHNQRDMREEAAMTLVGADERAPH